MIAQRLAWLGLGAHQMDKTRCHTSDTLVNGLQAGQQLLDSEGTEGAAALECCDVQGHLGA